jgi:predicted lipoprotein with Yx(FWY)xxD motif
MRLPKLAAGAALAAITLAACGSGSTGSYGSSPAATAPAAAAQTVKTAETSLGQVLVDENGHTLYGFTSDANGVPSCTDACASTWPPVVIDGATLPTGLDPKVFSVVARPDGTHQLEAGKWPLYRFAGDATAGVTNGQGSEGFFVATPAGGLIKTM